MLAIERAIRKHATYRKYLMRLVKITIANGELVDTRQVQQLGEGGDGCVCTVEMPHAGDRVSASAAIAGLQSARVALESKKISAREAAVVLGDLRVKAASNRPLNFWFRTWFQM